MDTSTITSTITTKTISNSISTNISKKTIIITNVNLTTFTRISITTITTAICNYIFTSS